MSDDLPQTASTANAPIVDDESLAAALAALVAHDPTLAAMAERLSPLPLRKQAASFEGLVRIIIGQQVSRASADAISTRLAEALDPITAQAVRDAGTEPLNAAGLSRPKQKTVLLLAENCLAGFDPAACATLNADEAMAQLTALHGIGPWTAQVFALFCTGHRDIFPAGDIALQHALADQLGLDARPDAKATAKLAERWQGHRSAAARLFYARYAELRHSALPV